MTTILGVQIEPQDTWFAFLRVRDTPYDIHAIALDFEVYDRIVELVRDFEPALTSLGTALASRDREQAEAYATALGAAFEAYQTARKNALGINYDLDRFWTVTDGALGLAQTWGSGLFRVGTNAASVAGSSVGKFIGAAESWQGIFDGGRAFRGEARQIARGLEDLVVGTTAAAAARLTGESPNDGLDQAAAGLKLLAGVTGVLTNSDDIIEALASGSVAIGDFDDKLAAAWRGAAPSAPEGALERWGIVFSLAASAVEFYLQYRQTIGIETFLDQLEPTSNARSVVELAAAIYRNDLNVSAMDHLRDWVKALPAEIPAKFRLIVDAGFEAGVVFNDARTVSFKRDIQLYEELAAKIRDAGEGLLEGYQAAVRTALEAMPPDWAPPQSDHETGVSVDDATFMGPADAIISGAEGRNLKLIAGPGDGDVIGRGVEDVVAFAGSLTDYAFAPVASLLGVARGLAVDGRAIGEGVKRLYGIDRMIFADGEVKPEDLQVLGGTIAGLEAANDGIGLSSPLRPELALVVTQAPGGALSHGGDLHLS